jgi:hypothetical protein
MDLTAQQVEILERLQRRDFQIVAFPMYASHVGVRKGNCAALLSPVASGGFMLFGSPSYLIEGNFSVRVISGGRDWLVWKKTKIEVTPARLSEIDAFAAELSEALLPNL